MGARRPQSWRGPLVPNLPMNLSLYSAATGMEAQELNLNTIANNLANVNTPGLQEEPDRVPGPALHQAPHLRGGHRQRQPGADRRRGGQRGPRRRDLQGFHPGPGDPDRPAARSGDPGRRIFRDPAAGRHDRPTPATARSSSTPQGQVVTADGLPVLSGSRPIPTGTTGMDISQTGQHLDDRSERHHRPSRSPSPGSPIRRACRAWAAISTPRPIRSGTASRRPAPAQNGYGTTLQGYLEGSNVNIVEEMVNLITAQRAYEINSKSVQASDQMLQNVAQMKQ